MRFQTPLQPARLIRRYKRFLADMHLPDGREVVAHCPNPGAMTGLAEPGMTCWIEANDDPRKKLKYGWRLVEFPGGLANIDTALPNRIVGEALRAGTIPALAGYTTCRAEVPYGTASRVDFLLSGGPGPDTLVEVKSVTLRREAGWGEFPDCVTTRGAKHLGELAQAAQSGRRAVVLYLLGRTDCTRLRLAADIDPGYARAAAQARAAGVEVLAFRSEITPHGITLGAAVPVA